MEKGRFLESIHGSQDYQYGGKVYRPKRVHPILYNGEPLTESYYILIDPAEIEESPVIVVFLTVGGKKSPLKRSEYKIHMDQITPDNPGNGLEIIEENKLVVDFHNDMEVSKQQLLNQLLGR